MSCALMWFREDLRVQDNTALTVACDENTHVVGLYLLDPGMWKAHDMAACRVEFILRNLACLQQALAKKNIPLWIVALKKSEQTLPFLAWLINAYALDALYFNDQYELDEKRRDEKIIAALTIPVKHFTDQVIFTPTHLLTHNQTPYTIFTPYKRRFLQAALESQSLLPLAEISKKQNSHFLLKLSDYWQHQGSVIYENPPVKIAEFGSAISDKQWPAGENFANASLKNFIAERLRDYDAQRDFPAQQATSQLSPYLSAGVLSPRQCFYAAMQVNHGRLLHGNSGIDCWISELIWREFYKQILANFPRISMHKAFKEKTEQWPWRHDEKIVNAWINAETGYPLIDAAMRQLHQIGWMHNRLRMVVAMFLTKDCFIDWRLGERYFMRHLVDGDLAANNGGWQWAASTGCDAVPYFRVFNPVRQSERFDPEGVFIKTYCPELRDVSVKQLHDPFKLPAEINYPTPIVDYRRTREFLKSTLK